jgi:hypothetical protein
LQETAIATSALFCTRLQCWHAGLLALVHVPASCLAAVHLLDQQLLCPLPACALYLEVIPQPLALRGRGGLGLAGSEQ